MRSACRSGPLGDDQFLFGFLFDHFFRDAAEFFFLKMHEFVFVVRFFFFLGHPRSPFDSPLFRGIRRRLQPSRAYKRNPACLSSVCPAAADSVLFSTSSLPGWQTLDPAPAGRELPRTRSQYRDKSE